jgi:hypothetical protein
VTKTETDYLFGESIRLWWCAMNTTFGEIVLLTLTASIIVFAVCREVMLCARWITSKRRTAGNTRSAAIN